MHETEFRRILKKYRSGDASPEEREMIDAWYEAMGRNADDLEVGDELGDRYWSNIVSRIHAEHGQKTERKILRMYPKRLIWYSGIAASLFVAAAFFFLTSDNPDIKKPELTEISADDTWMVRQNMDTKLLRLTLADGSTITLHPESSVKFPRHFNTNKSREVYLDGEAFFDVMPDANKPFLVYAKDVTAKVLGTSFSIRAFKGDNKVIVAVTTGKVAVNTTAGMDQSANDEVILTPNQQIVYDEADRKLAKGIVEDPKPVIDPQKIGRLRFEEAPVKEVLEAIEKIYGINIEFDEALFASCVLTTSISDGDLYNRLDLITGAIGATYTVIENKIVVRGPGCIED